MNCWLTRGGCGRGHRSRVGTNCGVLRRISEQQQIRWCVPSCARLQWRQWEDGSLAYHTKSGQTHYLNLFAASALQLLAERPATAAELAEEIRLAAGHSDVTGLEQIPALLEQFAELGLIAPFSP
jgi:PqqD family protein of HPr-rel-A system